MPRQIKHVDHRVVTVKTTLEIMRLFSTAYFKAKHYGSCATDFVVVAAVFVGQAEGRPLNASKISNFAGLPRPTVIRKLAELQTAGIVARQGNAYSVPPDVANSNEIVNAAMAARKQIVDAAAKLSKLDTKGIAVPTSWAISLFPMILG